MISLAGARTTSRPGRARTCDFDLHGVVGVRLLEATDDDVAKVRRQLGPIDATLGREPDISIRFVDSLPAGPLTLVGVGETGFDHDRFFVLRGAGAVRGRACIPFDRIGRGVELVCERSLTAVPHLLAVVNLTALSKGVLPLHATGFTSGSTGILVTGWSKGGKTEALLGCMVRGASYVGDEWVYLTEDGQMLGLPEPVRVWAWQLAQLPALLRSRPGRDRRRLALWRGVASVAGAATSVRGPGSSLLQRARPVVERQAYLKIPPAELFGEGRVALQGRVDAVVLVLSQEDPAITTRPASAAEVANRMQASLEEERAALVTHYRHFRYAFPERGNPLLDRASALESRLLTAMLAQRPCVAVAHPHPCDLRLLGSTVLEAVQAVLDGSADAVRPSPAQAVPAS